MEETKTSDDQDLEEEQAFLGLKYT